MSALLGYIYLDYVYLGIMRVSQDLKRFKSLVGKKAEGDEAWFWRLQVAARDAILSIDVSSHASAADALNRILEIFQLLLGGAAASIVLPHEKGWEVTAATGDGAADILGKRVDHQNGSITSMVIKNKSPYYFSDIDKIKKIKKHNHPARHAKAIFCSFPLLSFEGDVMGVINVVGMEHTHPFFAIEKGSINGALSAAAAKVAKLRKNAQVARLESSLASMKEAENIKERLLYMTIHDLKNPLSLVISNLAFLQELEHKDEAEEVIRLSRFACDRLLDMIKGALDSHKMEIGDFRLHASCFDLASMINDVIKEFGVIARMDEVTLKYDGPEKVMIVADGGVIRRILTNLMDNAMRHSPVGGAITIGVKDSDDETVISLMDEGAGISAEDADRIFNPYEQARSSLESGSNGTYGLGLAFCKMAAQAHKGSIRVISEEGAGAEFIVSIPKGLSEQSYDMPSSFM